MKLFSLEYKRGIASNSGNGWPGPNIFDPTAIFGKPSIQIYLIFLLFLTKDLGMRKRSNWFAFFNRNKLKRKTPGHFNDNFQMAEYL